MITHIKENKPELDGKVLIGEIKTPTDSLIDGETPIEDIQQSDKEEVKVWKSKSS